jgi:hypothetical protein
MLPAIVVERLPRLVRAIRCLSARGDEDEAVILADELAGITAMAEKFTNDRTAEGIGRAFFLTVGGVSLGLEHLLMHDGDEAALDFLVEHGAEHVFQAGFRLVKELSALPEDTLTCAAPTRARTGTASTNTRSSTRSARACRRSCAPPAGCAATITKARSPIPTSTRKG